MCRYIVVRQLHVLLYIYAVIRSFRNDREPTKMVLSVIEIKKTTDFNGNNTYIKRIVVTCISEKDTYK